MNKYKPFSDPDNIEKMVRYMDVFPEEETLEITLLNWKGDPHYHYRQNYGNWVKYVSCQDKNPRKLYLYWDRKTEDEFLEETTSDLLKNKNYFSELENYFFDSYKKFEIFTDKIFEKSPKFFAGKSNKEIIEFFKKFNAIHRYALAAYYVSYDVSLLLPRLVKRDTQEVFGNLADDEIDKIIQIFSSVGISSVVRIERLEFLERLKKIQKIYKKSKNWKDRKIQSMIFKHWYKFAGCSFNHGGDFNSLKDFQKKFLKSIKLDADREIKKIRNEEKKDDKTIRKHLAKFKKHPEALRHIGWLRRFMGYRNCDEEYYHSYFAHSLKFFDEISRRIGFEGNDMWLLSKREIINSLNGTLNPKKIVKARKKKGYTIKQVGNKIKVWTGVKKEDWHEQEVEKVKTLKGLAAYHGKVRGRVKVVCDPAEDMNKFNEGDILVTSMTTPHFVPLIKKARAIITDEGGLLCHAAIVSRELKTPCIIGTKIATKILKDGYLVEVDANKGIVKILRQCS